MNASSKKKETVLPLGAEEAACLFAPHLAAGERRRVALAISGGADSMALALCAKAAGLSCVALIVEHGLREESAAEAQTVKQRLEALGIETEILPWVHEEITSRVHAKARAARYALLVGACKKRGIKTLFLAHHADDQAETILMRLAKGSGIDGLAGMGSVVDFEDVRLVRPFLSVPKVRLIATCEAAGVAYVTDPSNASEKYARGRLRRVTDLLAEEGLTIERLLDLGERAGEAAAALDHYTRLFLCQEAVPLAGGTIRLALDALRALPKAVGLRALISCLQEIHATPYPPERQSLLGVYAFLLEKGEAKTRTFHGSLLQKNEAGSAVTFIREESGITDSLPIACGQSVLWDGRWQVTLFAEEPNLEIRSLGLHPREVLDRLSPALRRLVPQGRARAALPALWRGAELVLIPDFSEQNQVLASARVALPRWH